MAGLGELKSTTVNSRYQQNTEKGIFWGGWVKMSHFQGENKNKKPFSWFPSN